jgi:hypothetical protein
MFDSSVFTQRAYLVRHEFVNREHADASIGGTEEEVVYRSDASRVFRRGLLLGGAQIGHTTARQQFAASSWDAAAYGHIVWHVTPALTIAPGVRAAKSSLLTEPAVSRWLISECGFGHDWSLTAAAGVAYQVPEPADVIDFRAVGFRPERASYVDVGVEKQLNEATRVQAGVFARRETDVLWAAMPGSTTRLDGRAHGFELLIERRHANGLSGSAWYSYGKAEYSDRVETFSADFDQRHALNLFGDYQFSRRFSVGAAFRSGTNFPIAGYIGKHGDLLSASSERNRVRLPAYARLDVHAIQRFELFGRRITGVLEVINLLDRRNVGPARGVVDPSTGIATGFSRPLFGRRLSAALAVDF